MKKTYTHRIANTQNFLPPKPDSKFLPQTEVTIPCIFKPDSGFVTAYATSESLVGTKMAMSADTSVTSDIFFF